MRTNHPVNPTRLAFVGAGNIAGPYSRSVARHPELKLAGVYDICAEKAHELAAASDCVAYGSLEELADAGIDVVVNLTNAQYHFQTTRRLIGLGVTVFSEKPLALTTAQSRELVQLASDSGVRVACAPSLWLGRSYQEVARRVLDGEIGTVRLISAEVNQGRIESWHPAPQSFYQVGPVVDAGVYALTYFTAVFGPIRRVSGVCTRLLPTRTTNAGAEFGITAADGWVIAAFFESGQMLRLTCNFYVDAKTVPRTVDFHGDVGSLRLDDLFVPDAGIEYAAFGEAFHQEAPGEPLELDWSLGVLDLAEALRDGRPHRTSVEHAAHIVEVLEAIGRAAESNAVVDVESTFPSPFAAAAPAPTLDKR